MHIVTVNDYLAQRDSEWIEKIYKFLGLSVGLIIHDMKSRRRGESYNGHNTEPTTSLDLIIFGTIW